MITDTWEGCYPSKWQGLIIPDAFTHPAKFSSKLIRRIYEHITAEGWVGPGDMVIDPFGGVALGALDAMRMGLRWRGVELESHFVALGQGMNCRGIDRAFWRRYHGRGRLWLRLGVCPDCRRLLDDPIPLTSFMGAFSRLVPVRPAHRFQGNIETWSSLGLPGDAELLQGDSRSLASTLSQAQASVSSPPFLQSGGGTPEPKEGGVIDKALYERHRAGNAQRKAYGESDANLGNLRGNEDGFQAAISSPPYADGAQHTGGDDLHPGRAQGGKVHLPGIAGAVSSPPYAEMINSQNNGIDWDKAGRPDRTKPSLKRISPGVDGGLQYGSTPGQLGAMKAGEFKAAVSSPPYEGMVNANGEGPGMAGNEAQRKRILEGSQSEQAAKSRHVGYGDSAGNIGNDSGSDFWLAARQIVEQVYLVLAPGGHAVWVVKGFVKNKAYVDFPDQWRKLCEAVGFETLHEHRAMLVHRKGTQHLLEGGELEIKTESKSFFRRLAEKNGSPRIDWETVYCMQKPHDIP